MAEYNYLKMDDIVSIEHPEKKSSFRVSWKMTDFCPYSCSYCYMSDSVLKAKKLLNEPDQIKLEQIASHFDEMIEKLSDPNEKVQLHFIGGEPTVFDLKNIMSKIKSPRIKVVIIQSNIYRDFSYWSNLISYLRNRNIIVNVPASFHLEMLKTENARKEFLNKVTSFNMICKAVVNNNNITTYMPYFEELMKHNIEIDISLERGSSNSWEDLTSENQKLVESVRNYSKSLYNEKGSFYVVTLKNGRKIKYSSNLALLNAIKDGHLDTNGFYCNAGVHNVRILKNGDMYRAACRLCALYFKMGNVLDINSYNKITKELICETTVKGFNNEFETKYCPCCNNTNMYRVGYDRITGLFEKPKFAFPDYSKNKA